VFGAADLKGGATSSLYNVCSDPRLSHNPVVVSGVLGVAAQEQLQNFFRQLRENSSQK
jgi:tRNA(Arg) A34 adenosine deaminase TadA